MKLKRSKEKTPKAPKAAKAPARSAPILSNFDDLRVFSGRKAIVGSQLTFAVSGSHDKSIDSMVECVVRDAGKGFLANLRKSAPKLRIYGRKEVTEKPKVRFAFLVDAFLAYGLKAQKKDEILAVIGGVESFDERFPVDILLFNSKGLLRVQEVMVAPKDSPSFAGDCNEIVHALKAEFKEIRVVIAAPLSPWPVDATRHEPSIPLNKLLSSDN